MICLHYTIQLWSLQFFSSSGDREFSLKCCNLILMLFEYYDDTKGLKRFI